MKLKTLLATVLLVGSAAMATCSTDTLGCTPVAKYGRLKAKNGYLYESTGTSKVILRGMSYFWSSEPSGYYFFQAKTVSWLQSDWLASVIRIPLAVNPANSGNKGYLLDSATNVSRVLKLVNSAVAQGLYAIVDWHVVDEAGSSDSYTPYTTQAVAFFKMMAAKYKGVPNVMFEVWNEPTTDAGTILTHANTVISAIRKAGNGNLVIIGSPGYSSQPNNMSNATDDSANYAYTLHFYAGSSSHDSYRSNMTAAISAGKTVFVTEWGTTTYDGETWNNFSNSQTWMDLLTTNSVSSCNWDIGDQQSQTNTSSGVLQGSAALTKVASANGNWDTALELQASGRAVRDYLRKANSGLFRLPDTALRMLGPLTVFPDTGHRSDSFEITATLSKSVNWTLTAKGLTTGASYTWNGTSDSLDFFFKPTVHKKLAKYGAEKVAFSLTMASSAKAMTIKDTTDTLRLDTFLTSSLDRSTATSRLTALSWDAQGLRLPSGSLSAGETYTVRVRDLLGHQIGSTETAVARFANSAMVLDVAAPRRANGSALVELQDSEGGRTRLLLPPLR